MWAIYQFFISVVLLRILIVMMTITYRRIYDDLDKQWKYVQYGGEYIISKMKIWFFFKGTRAPTPASCFSTQTVCFHRHSHSCQCWYCSSSLWLTDTGEDSKTGVCLLAPETTPLAKRATER